jgi:hypothetical protein
MNDKGTQRLFIDLWRDDDARSVPFNTAMTNQSYPTRFKGRSGIMRAVRLL